MDFYLLQIEQLLVTMFLLVVVGKSDVDISVVVQNIAVILGYIITFDMGGVYLFSLEIRLYHWLSIWCRVMSFVCTPYAVEVNVRCSGHELAFKYDIDWNSVEVIILF